MRGCQSSRPLRIVILEDDGIIAILLEELLSDLGHPITGSATSIEGAMRLIKSDDFDLVILDVILRGRAAHPIAA